MADFVPDAVILNVFDGVAEMGRFLPFASSNGKTSRLRNTMSVSCISFPRSRLVFSMLEPVSEPMRLHSQRWDILLSPPNRWTPCALPESDSIRRSGSNGWTIACRISQSCVLGRKNLTS